ncbi:MAG TPA: regulatory protein RecX [Bacteroidales bacterium]|nr:regulatory protein RecX [Bacteroidales bacterium]HRW94725.1 regulatory protein RecX [Bacteroidales bacterium]
MDQEVFKKYLGKMQALCSRGEKCRADIRMKLNKAGLPEDLIMKILDDLQKEEFIDEQRYAGAFARDKSRLQGWGPVKISGMLKMKKIPKEIIESALYQLDEDLLMTGLKEALKKKDKTIKDTDPVKRHARLVRFGISKGYTFWQVIRVLERLKK